MTKGAAGSMTEKKHHETDTDNGNTEQDEGACPPSIPEVLLPTQRLIEERTETDNTEDTLSIVFDAMESALSAVVITDIRGRIVYANTAFLRMFDYSERTEVLGKNAVEVFPSKDIRSFSDFNAVTELAENHFAEFIVQRKSGEKFVVEASSSSVTASDGQIVGNMASFLDITLRKQAEEEREHALQELRAAFEKIKVLKGLVPICAWCKNVRDDSGFWKRVEQYVEEHSEARFSHGICPNCYKKTFPNLLPLEDEKA